MIDRRAIFHQAESSMCFPVSPDRVRLRFRAARGNCDRVEVLYGDKYNTPAFRRLDMAVDFSTALHDFWCATVEVTDRRLAYYFRVRSGAESADYLETGFSDEPLASADAWKGFFQIPFIHESSIHRAPSWVQGTVFYLVFVDRFARAERDRLGRWRPADLLGRQAQRGQPNHRDLPSDGRERAGGNLRGIIGRLDYLASLGVGGLYLTPIFKSASYHKYDTGDYRKVDPDFGAGSDLRELVEQAHRRGIRVVLDAVFNHCGADFGPFADLRRRGPKSRYRDWFHVRKFPIEYDELSALASRGHWNSWFVRADGSDARTYETFAFVPGMPKLNTGNPAVRKYLLGAAKYWTRTARLDGWRLDVGDEVDHPFWREFRAAIRSENPEAYLVGEIGHDSRPWLAGDQHDAVMNYGLAWLCDRFFARSEITADAFRDGVTTSLMRYSDQANSVMMNLLESHDTARFMTRCGSHEGRHLLALTFIMAFPGCPMLYYGEEIALEGGDDPDNRRRMPWDSPALGGAFIGRVRRLTELRAKLPELRMGDFRWRDVGRGMLGFSRGHSGLSVLVIGNPSDEPAIARLDREWVGCDDVLEGRVTDERLTLQPWGAAIIVGKNDSNTCKREKKE